MASQLIAHVAAWYIPTGQPLVNDMDGLTIDGAYRLEAQRMHSELERRARGQPLCVEIDIRPVKNKRTLDQNRLMWALLNRLALALSGDTPGGVTAEQCYLDLLGEFGAEVETWRVPVKALPALHFWRDELIERMRREHPDDLEAEKAAYILMKRHYQGECVKVGGDE